MARHFFTMESNPNCVRRIDLLLEDENSFEQLVSELSSSLYLSATTQHERRYLMRFSLRHDSRMPNVAVAELGKQLSKLSPDATLALRALARRELRIVAVSDAKYTNATVQLDSTQVALLSKFDIAISVSIDNETEDQEESIDLA